MTAVNHVVIDDLDLALIQGTDVMAFCGEIFVPRIRVGSGGRADDPSLPMCPDCEDARTLLLERAKLRDERRRIKREMKALLARVNDIWESQHEAANA